MIVSNTPQSAGHQRPGTAADDDTQVRSVSSSDFEGLYLLAGHRSFGEVVAASQVQSLHQAAAAPVAWVAESQDRIAGFALASEGSDRVSHIFEVRVHGQYQGRDIARRLAQAALESARENDCLKVVLHNPARPVHAREIMEGLGFVFSRSRDYQGEVCLEFYLDLYAMLPAGALLPAGGA